jgi:acyl carrier protein
MTREKIYAMFAEVLAEHFEIADEQMNTRARLIADLDLDSLDRIALGTAIEQRSGVALEERDIRDCETIGELIDRFAARIEERAV